MLGIAAAIIGSAVIGGIASYFGSKESATAQQAATEAQLQAQGVSEAERKRIQGLIEKLQDPQYQSSMTSEEIESLFQYFPQITDYIVREQPAALPYIAAEYPTLIQDIKEQYPQVEQIIREEAPKMVEKTQGAKEAEDAQRAALQALRNVGTEGDMISKMEMAKARESAATAESGQRGAITEEMARRGQLGGGRELLMKLAGQQASQQQAAMTGMDAAQNAIRNRLSALSQGASIGGQMYGQEMALANKNTDIINQYNQRNTSYSRQQEAKRIADINAYQSREAAAQRQREAANVAAQNRFAEQNTAYARSQVNAGWQAQEAWKANAADIANQNIGKRDAVTNQWKQQKDAERRGLILSERDRTDAIERERYNRDVGKIQLQQGQSGQVVGDAYTNAQIEQQRANQRAAQAQATAGFWGDLAKTGVQAVGAYNQSEMDDIDYQLKKAELDRLKGGTIM